MGTEKTLKKLNIAISAGHSTNPKRDRGAASGKLIEGELASKSRSIIISYINKKGYSVLSDGDDTILADSMKYFKGKTNENTIVLDIHFNAGPATAKGIEVLIPSVSTGTERKIAEKLATIISSFTKSPLRGVKGVKTEAESHHGKLGWMAIAGQNVLIEMEFISNPDAMKTYLSKETEINEAIAQYLINEALSIAGTTTTSSNDFYVVKSGDSLSKIATSTGLTVAKLQSINNITNPNSIKIGQRLKLS